MNEAELERAISKLKAKLLMVKVGEEAPAHIVIRTRLVRLQAQKIKLKEMEEVREREREREREKESSRTV